MPTTLEAIYDLLKSVGVARQPTFNSKLSDLDRVLRLFGATNPYNLNNDAIRELMKHAAFSLGGGGALATPSPSYVYRVSSISKALQYCTRWIAATPRHYEQPWVVFRYWEAEVARTDAWLRLSDYAVDNFESPRGFTFWTSQQLDPMSLNELLRDIRDMGIPNSWLDEYSVVLRCNLRNLERHVRIPTVLDAFNSHIFHPTRQADAPASGFAIRLSVTDDLSLGNAEFVLRSIPVSAIDMYPVLVQCESTAYIDSFDRRLIDRLGRYYVTL